MSKIKSAFEQGKALAVFLTCGDPDLETTAAAVRAAAENGANLIILGIPFSDPTAEGPVIQASNMRALGGGVTTDKIFSFVKELRRGVKIPLAFMTYANVVFSYGAERFLSQCEEAEVDGLILPDVPLEEKEDFLPFCRSHGVDLVSLAAPAPEKRLARIAAGAEGFLYIVPGPETEEAGDAFFAGLASMVETIRQNSPIPCAVCSHLSDPEQAGKIARLAGGVIAASAAVTLLEKYGKDAPRQIGEYVKAVKEAIVP